MKKTDFIRCMDSIDPRYVKEAENYRPRSMAGVKILSLAACLAIIVTAIPVSMMLTREDENQQPVVITPVEDIVVTPGGEESDKKETNAIYCGSDLVNEELIKLAFDNQEVEILNIGDFHPYLQVYFASSRTLKPDINVPEKLDFTVGGTSVSATLKTVYYAADNPQVSDAALRENNKIAEYQITSINGEKRGNDYSSQYDVLYYNVTAKEIISFNTHAVQWYEEAELSEKELMDIVEKDVTQLYGKDFLSKHSVEIYSYHKKTTAIDRGGWKYDVMFRREIDGIRVDEYVSLTYNGYGQLYQIHAYNLNSFDAFESKITDEALDEVDEKAIKILDGRLIKNKYLEITTDGRVYVSYYYYLREGDNRYSPDEARSNNLRIKVNID